MKLQSASVRMAALSALAGLLLAGPLPAPAGAAPHRADGNVSDWRGDATMLAGQTTPASSAHFELRVAP